MPIAVYKNQGETPLQAILRLKKENPTYTDKKVSYAGRLDPMAEGLLLLLIGDENKNRNEYEKYEKTYDFTILFGIETDTYDLLGMPEFHNCTMKPRALQQTIQSYISSHKEPFEQTYPPYSSKPVNGKPLYYWARHGKLKTIELPTKEVVLSAFSLRSLSFFTTKDLEKKTIDSIGRISGDFRQTTILSAWKSLLKHNPDTLLPVAMCRITCSSGTYIRSIAHDIGQEIGCGAIALSIERTQIGPYTKETLVRFG